MKTKVAFLSGHHTVANGREVHSVAHKWEFTEMRIHFAILARRIAEEW